MLPEYGVRTYRCKDGNASVAADSVSWGDVCWLKEGLAVSRASLRKLLAPARWVIAAIYDL